MSYQHDMDQWAALFNKRIGFIGGCFKSGTTWLQNMLDGHSGICSKGEAWFVKSYETFLSFIKYYQGDDPLKQMTEEQVISLFRSLLLSQMANWGGSTDATWIIEKTPRNTLTFEHLKKLFPHAKLIHIIRDGRDVAVSAWFHHKRLNTDLYQELQHDFKRFVLVWTERFWMPQLVTALQFGINSPDDYIEVRYEDLVLHPVQTLGELLADLDVSVEESEISSCLEGASFEKMSKGRAPGEEDRNSFYRKGISGDWSNHFDDELNQRYLEMTGRLMETLGYV